MSAHTGRGEAPISSHAPRHCNETFGPPVLIEGVEVDEEAVRLVTKPRQLPGTDDAVLSLLLSGEDAKNLQVVPFPLVPLQFAVLATMLSRPSVQKRRMPNVPEQKDVHGLTT